MTTRINYAVHSDDELDITGLEAMYQVILYIRKNLMHKKATAVTVTKTVRQEFTANPDMHMADFLAWLGEDAEEED